VQVLMADGLSRRQIVARFPEKTERQVKYLMELVRASGALVRAYDPDEDDGEDDSPYSPLAPERGPLAAPDAPTRRDDPTQLDMGLADPRLAEDPELASLVKDLVKERQSKRRVQDRVSVMQRELRLSDRSTTAIDAFRSAIESRGLSITGLTPVPVAAPVESQGAREDLLFHLTDLHLDEVLKAAHVNGANESSRPTASRASSTAPWA
jgi:hypothetical protein